ncbi:MAG TPA: TIGR03086 family metal-binding protein [Trebonia sp.]
MDTVDLGPAASSLAGLITRVADGDLGRPTPCPAYTLGDLTEHVGGMALAFASAAAKDGKYGERQPSGDASRLSGDWRSRIVADRGALAEAWRAPGAWEGMTRIAGMDAPAAMVGITAADELVVHGWDVARAMGQPYDCEPELLDAARRFLDVFASPDAEAGPTVMFGPSRPVPDGAAELDRVIALAGRDPGWQSPVSARP